MSLPPGRRRTASLPEGLAGQRPKRRAAPAAPPPASRTPERLARKSASRSGRSSGPRQRRPPRARSATRPPAPTFRVVVRVVRGGVVRQASSTGVTTSQAASTSSRRAKRVESPFRASIRRRSYAPAATGEELRVLEVHRHGVDLHRRAGLLGADFRAIPRRAGSGGRECSVLLRHPAFRRRRSGGPELDGDLGDALGIRFPARR